MYVMRIFKKLKKTRPLFVHKTAISFYDEYLMTCGQSVDLVYKPNLGVFCDLTLGEHSGRDFIE